MVKEKPNSTRTYDDDGFRRRAACLCFSDDTEAELLLVTGSRDPKRWVVPGGGIEPTEDAGVAAVREVWEEAGVKGTLGRCLGVFENHERKTRTSVFVLVAQELLDDWDDQKNMGRKRKWFKLEEAREQLALHKPVQVSYLQLLNQNNHVRHAPVDGSTALAQADHEPIISHQQGDIQKLVNKETSLLQ